MSELKASYENTFKQPGYLEIAKKIEPLPPTEISEKALEIMKSWGLEEELITDLQHFTSQFRYDLCPHKIERLSEKPAEIFEEDGVRCVNFPSFFDVSGRLDGQCGDISRQWIAKINDSGLLDKMSNSLKEKGVKIYAGSYTGLSKTHFCTDKSNHVWNGLSVYKDPLDDSSEIIIVDASFQKIMTHTESGYTMKTGLDDARHWQSNENLNLKLSTFETVNEYRWKATINGSVVIGISSDYKSAYCLCLAQDDKKTIRPIIETINEDGSCAYYLKKDDGNFSSTNDSEISNEIIQMITATEKIQFVEKEPTINVVDWNKKNIQN